MLAQPWNALEHALFIVTVFGLKRTDTTIAYTIVSVCNACLEDEIHRMH